MRLAKCNTCQCNICAEKEQCGQYEKHPCAVCQMTGDDFALLDWIDDICAGFKPKQSAFVSKVKLDHTNGRKSKTEEKIKTKPEYARIRVLKEPNGMDPELIPPIDSILLAMKGIPRDGREFCIVPIFNKKVILRKKIDGTRCYDMSEYEEIEEWHSWEEA